MTLAFPAVAGVEIVRLAPEDLSDVTRLCFRCSAFFELIEGQPVSDATAEEILGELEPEYSHGVKHVWGAKKEGGLIAVAGLLEGHPLVREWYIGLLLIDPKHRRRGLGSRLCASLLDWIARLDGVAVRLVVQQQNPGARVFWERQGFVLERQSLSRTGALENAVWVMVRQLKQNRM